MYKSIKDHLQLLAGFFLLERAYNSENEIYFRCTVFFKIKVMPTPWS